MKQHLKRFLIILGIILLVVVLAAAGLVIWLTVTQYNPEDQEEIAVTETGTAAAFSGNTVSVLTFNTGYAGLGDNADFFMDGGTSVRPTSKDRTEENMEAILSTLQEQNTDFVFLQETDQNSKRSYHIDENAYYSAAFANSAFALNYKCNYVPYPLPTLGKVSSGVMTLSDYQIASAERIQLPLSFSWPVSVANLKRCMLVSRVPIDGTDAELVLINFHLEAYDDGAGKLAQTKMLVDTITEEYEKGNYVIAGGDFNQSFTGWDQYYPITEEDGWVPGTLSEDVLPEGWQFACDLTTPSCRSLKTAYTSGSQCYVIDGFILSPNITLNQVQTLDLGFRNSDHNPVRLDATLN